MLQPRSRTIANESTKACRCASDNGCRALTNQACTSTGGGITMVLNGTESVTDDEPAAKAWAFTAGYDLSVDEQTQNGHITTTQKGTAVGTHPGGVFQTKYDLTQTGDVAGQGHNAHVSDAMKWTAVYAPSTAWTPGDPPAAGTFTVDGNWDVAISDNGDLDGGDMTVVTLTPPAIDPNCSSLITAGALSASTQGHVVTVTWTGCNTTTVTYAGP